MIIRHRARLDFVQVGQNLYPDPNPNARLFDLGNGRQVVNGYYACIKKNMWSMSIQFKDKSGAFYKPINVVDFLDDCFGCNRGGGDRGSRGGGQQRGGRGGGYGGPAATSVKDRNFWRNASGDLDRQKVSQAEKYLKGLQVSHSS